MHDITTTDFRQFRAFGGIIAPLGYQVMPSDHRTVADVDARHSICIPFVSTKEATEFEPVPVAGVDVSALRTSSTGVLGTDAFESNALGCCLIGDEELPLGVRPTADLVSHFLALGKAGFSDVRKILHHDAPRPYGLGVLHEPLRGHVHQLGRNLGFVSGHPLEKPLGRPGPLGLHLGLRPANLPSAVVQLSSREGEGLGIGGVGCGEDAFDARINSDHASFGLGFDFRNLVAEDEIPVIPLLAEFGILPCFDFRNPVVVDDNWSSPETKPLLVEGEVSFPYYGDHLPAEDYGMPTLLRPLGQKCGRDVLEGGAGKLGRKTEFLTDRTIMLSVKTNGVALFRGVDDRRNPVAGGKELDAEFVELNGRPQLDLYGSDIHYSSLFSDRSEYPFKKNDWLAFSPTLKMSGFQEVE